MSVITIGVIVNKERAERYYQLALKQKELDQQETDQFILQTLKYALSMNNYNILTPINYIMERTVKLLWNMWNDQWNYDGIYGNNSLLKTN